MLMVRRCRRICHRKQEKVFPIFFLEGGLTVVFVWRLVNMKFGGFSFSGQLDDTW